MQVIKRGLAPQREATTLQVFLQASGYPVNPDGRFGGDTDRALRAFQRDHGLIVDGVAGEKTWTAMFALHPNLLVEMSKKWLSQQDIEDFATEGSLDVRAAFGGFIAANRHRGKTLLRLLQVKDWASFAAGYNGPAYAQNRYDVKLAEAYRKYRPDG